MKQRLSQLYYHYYFTVIVKYIIMRKVRWFPNEIENLNIVQYKLVTAQLSFSGSQPSSLPNQPTPSFGTDFI
jgi:hypothetical protein